MENTTTDTNKAKRVLEIIKSAEERIYSADGEGALSALNEGLALEPRNVEILYLRGRTKKALQQYESALDDLDAAIEIESENIMPDYEYLYCERALLCYRMNRMRDVYFNCCFLEELKNYNLTFELGKSKDVLLAGVRQSELQITRLIGSGTFGKVQLATWNGRQVALKTPLNVCREQVINEAMTSMKFRHPNIVSAEALCHGQNEEVSFVMEYAPDGSLYDLLYTRQVKLTREQILKYARDVASGLAYLHKRRVIHRDLKSANILLFKDFAKICDFGQSRFLNEKSVAKTVVGTIGYIAPEVLAEEHYDEKSDVYSFGVLLYEMCVGTILPSIGIEADRMNKIMSSRIEYEDIEEVIFDCCKTNPTQRPTSQSCLDRVAQMLEDLRKEQREDAAREQCYAKFKELLQPWNDIPVTLKHHLVTMFLGLMYERPIPIDTNKLLPSNFAFEKEFISIARSIIAKYRTDEEKERMLEFAPPECTKLFIPARIVLQRSISFNTINVLMCDSYSGSIEEYNEEADPSVALMQQFLTANTVKSTFLYMAGNRFKYANNGRYIKFVELNRKVGPIDLFLYLATEPRVHQSQYLARLSQHVQVIVVYVGPRENAPLKGQQPELGDIPFHSVTRYNHLDAIALACTMAKELQKWQEKKRHATRLFKNNPEAYFNLFLAEEQ